MFGAPDHLFSVMSVVFPLLFVIVFGIIVFSIVRGIVGWSYNNKQPVLTVNSRIVSKRADVKHHNHNNNGNMNHYTNTTYYVTFEVESGDRLELKMSGREYGMLAERDKGRLTFQGSRYLGFERHSSPMREG